MEPVAFFRGAAWKADDNKSRRLAGKGGKQSRHLVNDKQRETREREGFARVQAFWRFTFN